MSLERGSFAEVPLRSLFAEATADDLKRMRRAADTLDATTPPSGITWEWVPQHASFPGETPGPIHQILLATVIMDAEDLSDWHEFDIDVEWSPLGGLAVAATVNVACYCETDHGTHNVDELVLRVDHDVPLGEAFQTASRRMATWLQDPRSAPWWRTKAGLPNP